MKNLIGDWVGKKVQVTLRATVPTPLHGTLLKAEECGVVLDMAKGQTFVPMTSILHISPAPAA